MIVSADLPFRMTVLEVFGIIGRGTVAAGRIESGTLRVGDEIEILHISGGRQRTVVTGVELISQVLAPTEATVGVLLKDVSRSDLKRGDVLTGVSAEVTRRT